MQITIYILGCFWEINIQDMGETYRIWSAEPELRYYTEHSDWRRGLAQFIVDNFFR